MLSLIAFWISAFDKLPTRVVVSVFVVAVGFGGAVVEAVAVAVAVGVPDEPSPDGVDVADAVGAVVVVALVDG